MYGNEYVKLQHDRPQLTPDRAQILSTTALGAPAPMTREPDVARVVNDLERNVTVLSDRLSILESRLSPVMSSLSPAGGGGDAGLPPACELSAHLRTLSDRVAEQAARASEILSRLEI